MAQAWQQAADELAIGVVSPFFLEGETGPVTYLGLIQGFGSPLGTLVIPLDSPDREQLAEAAKTAGYYYSLLAHPYDRFDRDLFVETLNDWGWKGAETERPGWCTEEPWTV